MTFPRPPRADLALDTSAVLAMLLGEPGADELEAELRASRGPVMSAATLTELEIVAETKVAGGGASAARALLDAARVVIVPVDNSIAAAARECWLRYGKGHHPARLNFGDCFAYATARHYEVPLLCVGADFAQTDVEVLGVTGH